MGQAVWEGGRVEVPLKVEGGKAAMGCHEEEHPRKKGQLAPRLGGVVVIVSLGSMEPRRRV